MTDSKRMIVQTTVLYIQSGVKRGVANQRVARHIINITMKVFPMLPKKRFRQKLGMNTSGLKMLSYSNKKTMTHKKKLQRRIKKICTNTAPFILPCFIS